MKTFALPLMSAFLFIASVESYSNDREQNERDQKRAAEIAAIPGQKVAREKCLNVVNQCSVQTVRRWVSV